MTSEASHKHPYTKLSIQVSLNGLSFCVLDTIGHKILVSERVDFKTASTPYLVLKELKSILEKHDLTQKKYDEVSVIHTNHLYCLVPKSLFDKEELPNYLKFNAKILANDQIVHDLLPNQDIVCVYVPFMNINNYLFECFGEFEFKHNSIALLQTLFQQKSTQIVCYVHVGKRTMELTVMEQRKLLLYNQFDYKTEADFLYYVLFVYEQLGLDVEVVSLKLFGAIAEGDAIFSLCQDYLTNVSLFTPFHSSYDSELIAHSDFYLTLLNNI
ncbi:MAG: DUF3822 family protein [Bacteroidota bacterium]